jgi:hypothetical protein
VNDSEWGDNAKAGDQIQRQRTRRGKVELAERKGVIDAERVVW